MKIKKKFQSIIKYIRIDVWKVKYEPGFKGFMIRALKVLLITNKEIGKDQIMLKSSAVAYFSILSVVPVVALVFGIAKGFGLEINLREEMSSFMPGQETVMETTLDFAQNMMDNAQGGVIAGASILVLIFTVMRLLNNIEDVFNSIWGKQIARSWVRKFTDYLALLIVAPIFVVLSSSATVYLETQMMTVGEKLDATHVVEPLIVFIVTFSPYILIWILYTMVYVIMPNTKVNFKAGLWAGIIAGTVFQLTQWGFINFSVGVAKYNAIYGSFAVLPLFFIFTQLSWTIVFIGGELSYAFQFVDDYIPDEKNIVFSWSERKKITLIAMRRIVKAFENGEKPYTKKRLSEELEIPHRFVSNAINRLIKAELIYKSLSDHEIRHVYLPAIDINKIDVDMVIHRLESNGVNDLFTKDKEHHQKLLTVISDLESEIKASKSNVLLKDL